MEEDKTKSALAWVSMLAVILAVGLVGAVVGLINTSKELEKYKAIMDVACDYSTSRKVCERGVEMLKGMDVKDIKLWSK